MAKIWLKIWLKVRKWHKKNQIGENGGERKKNPSANPAMSKIRNYEIMRVESGLTRGAQHGLVSLICEIKSGAE